MTSILFPEANSLKSQLLHASKEYSARCLYRSAKWCGELALSLADDDSKVFGVDEGLLNVEEDSIRDDADRGADAGGDAVEQTSEPRESTELVAPFADAAQHQQSIDVDMDADVDRSLDMDQSGTARDLFRGAAASLTPIPRLKSATRAGVSTTSSVGTPASPTSRQRPKVPRLSDARSTLNASMVNTDEQRRIEVEEDTQLSMAKIYFDAKEFARVPDVLKHCRSLKALFLAAYTEFLVGEKRREENQHDAAERNLSVLNESALPLIARLERAAAAGQLDGPCLYVLAIAHRESGDVEAARRVLCAAVSAAPLLWCAWHELALIVDDERDDGLTRTASSSPPALARAQPLALPAHWMRALFAVRAHRQLEHNVACVRLCVALERTFPRSSWLRAEHAIALYNLREIDAAAALFEKQLLEEPSRLDNLDSYSNILYVNEESGKLSMLAHRATSIDRYRPETCYIVGNYYSMKGEHAKAIVYFKRALRLDPRHLGTWTLVGHEYVELKNTEAAVEAYRKAVDANRRDYRAWYGLGQTYEILKMPLYALHYFRCAAAVRPFDARMWCSLGSCFEQLARIAEAIRCYERAVGNNDREGVAYKSLARLYQLPATRNDDRAAYYFRKELTRLDRDSVQSQATIDALLFLADHCRKKQLYDDAERYLYRLLDFNGREKEVAKSMLLSINTEKLSRH